MRCGCSSGRSGGFKDLGAFSSDETGKRPAALKL